jgi:hypothetical protein
MARPPDLTGLKYGRDIAFPVERLQVRMYNASGGAVGFTSANDGAGLLVWLFRDALLQRIDAEVDVMIGAREGLAPDAREKVISRLGVELMDLERVDAEATWAAIARGLAISHREDVAIPALLGIRLVTEPAQPSPSWPQVFDVIGVGGR